MEAQPTRIADVGRIHQFAGCVKIKESKAERRKIAVPLNIKHPEADRLARELAKRTGESITDAVIKALRERLAREEGRFSIQGLKDEILAIGKRCAALPDLDTRSADEILGYDEHGLPR